VSDPSSGKVDFRLELEGPEFGLHRLVEVLVRRGAVEVRGADDDIPPVDLVAAAKPDVVIVDLRALADGVAALGEIRAASPDSTVVALTRDEDFANMRSTDALGADAYLHEGVDVEQQAQAVIEAVFADPRGSAAALPPDLRSAGPARTFAAQAVRAWGNPELEDTVKLLVTELVTNAVRHADSSVEVKLALLPEVIRVEVRDQDPALPTPRQAEATAESGRGLALIESLATTWGVTPIRDGKRVWFELHRSDAAN